VRIGSPRLVEKPDRETAEKYLRGRRSFWTADLSSAGARFLSELSRFEPELMEDARESLRTLGPRRGLSRLDQQAFDRCRAVAIDSPFMERTDRMAVIPVDCGWTMSAPGRRCGNGGSRRVGTRSWPMCSPKQPEISYIRSEGPLVATVRREDLIVIATPMPLSWRGKTGTRTSRRSSTGSAPPSGS